MDPTGLHNVNGTLLRDALIALLAAGGLIWFIGNRIGKFKHWMKEELMTDAQFRETMAEAVAEKVKMLLSEAFREHEEREFERSSAFERRVENRLIQFESNLRIVESKFSAKRFEED